MMNLGKRKLIIYIIAAFLAGSVFTGAAAFAVCKGALGYVGVSKDDYKAMSDTYEKYGKLEQLYKNIDTYYYKDINDEDLLNGAYKGLVSGLGDPYSSFMTADEYESWKASAVGEYSGAGITFSEDKNGNYVVVGVSKNSPAEKAGIKTGDYILEVDGKTYDDMELLANAIRGKEGTKVKIKYYSDSKEKEVTLKREKIAQESVEYKILSGNIGYIKLTSFIKSSYDDFKTALSELEKKNVKGLILDLRDNGGGLVNTCIEIADEFLDEGIVTYVEDKNKKRNEYKSEDGKTDLKTVTLVNENSASCSEILAAALKDNGIKIVGNKTFGKGVIQSTMELSDGSALKLTIMQYFSPKGNVINEKGVTPDYEIKNAENSSKDEQLEKAMSLF
ncbi:MAG: S41 family peptidase [Anaerovoracaceae bacterium]